MDQAEVKEMWRYVLDIFDVEPGAEQPPVDYYSMWEMYQSANRIYEWAVEKSGLDSLELEDKKAKLNGMIEGLDDVVEKSLRLAQVIEEDPDNEEAKDSYIANAIAVHIVVFRLRQLLHSLSA